MQVTHTCIEIFFFKGLCVYILKCFSVLGQCEHFECGDGVFMVYGSQGEQMCFPVGHHKHHPQSGIHTFSGNDEGYQVACNLSSHIMESVSQQNRDSNHSKQTNRQKGKILEQWLLDCDPIYDIYDYWLVFFFIRYCSYGRHGDIVCYSLCEISM